MSNVLEDSQLQRPDVYSEGGWLYGAIVTAVFYGIVIVLYAMCSRSLWDRIRSDNGISRKHLFFFVYVNFLFVLSTLYVASNSRITQLGFIDHRNYPGGPSAYEQNTASTPLNIAFVVSNWCADALMTWRCVVIYRDCKLHLFVTGFGWLLMLASVVTGSLWLITVSQPVESATGWMSFTLLFPYICVSLAINIFLSLLTVLRLLYHRARISGSLGRGYGSFYTSFAAITIESAAVYSICSLLYLIPYAMNSPLSFASMQALGEAQVVAPLLIILRVSEDKAWTKDTTTLFTSRTSRSIRPQSSSSRPQKLSVQVALECIHHIDHDSYIDEGKDLAV